MCRTRAVDDKNYWTVFQIRDVPLAHKVHVALVRGPRLTVRADGRSLRALPKPQRKSSSKVCVEYCPSLTGSRRPDPFPPWRATLVPCHLLDELVDALLELPAEHLGATDRAL